LNKYNNTRVFIGITGASGSIYAERLIGKLVELVDRIYIVSTEAGEKVARYELTQPTSGPFLLDLLSKNLTPEQTKIIRVLGINDLFAPVASGTSAPTHMVIVPCSMGTLARVATGVSSSLLERTADVMIKQKKPLIVVPRETPLSPIHLKNMLTLCELGAHIIPAMPGFYFKPKSLDDLVNFVVGRILDSLELSHGFYKPWNHRMR
jgi:4-hydroxy-3-polyprenylbenzoate decarboxylase